MKTYSLPSGLYNLAFLLLIFMTAIPVAASPLVFRTVIDPRAERVEPGFQQVVIATIFLGYMLMMVVAWAYVLKWLIRTIEVHADSTVEFKTFLGRTVLAPHQIRSIELVTTEEGIATRIMHVKGRVSIPEQMGDMSELVSLLKLRNPRIEVTKATS